MASKLDYFQKRLEEEREKLEKELSLLAKRNPDDPSKWDAAVPEIDVMLSDATEMADAAEEFENQFGIGVNLEERYKMVISALKRIEEGKYGKCTADGKPIKEERLEADPAVATCIEHSLKESSEETLSA